MAENSLICWRRFCFFLIFLLLVLKGLKFNCVILQSAKVFSCISNIPPFRSSEDVFLDVLNTTVMSAGTQLSLTPPAFTVFAFYFPSSLETSSTS